MEWSDFNGGSTENQDKAKPVMLTGNSLTIEDVVEVARYGRPVQLSAAAILKIEESRQMVVRLVGEKKVVYGITTGFGNFANVVIDQEQTEQLQKNLIMSHATGVGKPLDEEIVRAIMLLRANSLAKGYSGARVEVIHTLLAMVNKGVHPIIPEKGSVGSSGDLAPLSHMVLVMLGMGEAIYQGIRMSGKMAMEKAGISLVTLKAKEGLALINGTQVMTAIGALAVHDARLLALHADIMGALSVEALEGLVSAYDDKLHQARPHQGQLASAEFLRWLLTGS
ncbi:MAG: aromatic amino acid lyase, partial [Bacillota bacterium]|nr:aromatic amino acid lyase [Bacillota bacterium]